jgi:hypothetical protein
VPYLSLAVTLVGCVGVDFRGTGGTSEGDGAGGANASTTSSASTTLATSAASTTSASSGAGGSSGTGPAACDTGEAAAIDSSACRSCNDCAVAGECADEFETFANGPGSNEWVVCVFGDGATQPGCPGDDPATPEDELNVCVDACSASWPEAASSYGAAVACMICFVCPNNCDAATHCGG